MSTTTDVLSLFKYDPVADADSTFNITQALNNNWDKLDAAILLAIAAAGAYNPEESYAVGDYCTYKGKLRKCSTAIPTGETWTEAHWTTTTVAAELAELSSQLSNRVLMPVQIPADADLNTLRTPGFYWCDEATNANRPDDSGSFCLLIEKTGSWGGNGVKQTFTNYDSGAIYTRVSPKDIWNPWRLLATATPPQEFDLPLVGEFVHYDPVTKSTYSKSQEGLVVVHFYCKKADGTDIVQNDTIAMLPEGFHPSANVHIPANVSFDESSVYSQDVATAVADPTGRVWIAYPPAGCKAVTTTLVFYAAS